MKTRQLTVLLSLLACIVSLFTACTNDDDNERVSPTDPIEEQLRLSVIVFQLNAPVPDQSKDGLAGLKAEGLQIEDREVQGVIVFL